MPKKTIKTTKDGEIKILREGIDAVDKKIVGLLAERGLDGQRRLGSIRPNMICHQRI